MSFPQTELVIQEWPGWEYVYGKPFFGPYFREKFWKAGYDAGAP